MLRAAGTAPTGGALPVDQGLRFGRMFFGRDLREGQVQIAQALLIRRLVFEVEGKQLVEDVAALTQTRMAEDLSAGDHVERHAAKAARDLDMAEAWVFAGGLPGGGEHAEALVAQDQVVGDAHDDGAEGAVGATDEGTIGVIDTIALIA